MANWLEKWRPSLRAAGARLDLLSLLQTPLGQDAKFVRQMLRLTGNLCIDHVPTKEYASRYLAEITTCLKTMPDNFDVAAGTIANIFTDNPEPSTELAVQLGIPDVLAKGLVVEHLLDIDSPIAEAVVYLLANAIDSFYKSTTQEVSAGFIKSMLQMPILFWDHELHDDIVAVVAILLENDMVQSQIANSHADSLVKSKSNGSLNRSLMKLFIELYEKIASGKLDTTAPRHSVEEGVHDVATSPTPGKNKSVSLETQQILHALQNVAGGIAAHMKYHSLETGMKMDPVLQYFTTVTREDSIPFRTDEICLAFVYLGNLARTKEVCIGLVQNFDFHERATSVIRSIGEEIVEMRYLAVGYLCNIANAAEEHKAIICRSKVIPTLIDHAPPQRLGDGLRLLRAVVKNSPQQCQILLAPTEDSSDCLVKMSHLEEQLPTMTPSNTIEVARLIVAILRSLQSGDTGVTCDTFMTLAFTNCLLSLTEQGVQSPIAPEGLLGFGLIAQTPAGVEMVSTSLEIGGNLPRFLKAVGEGNENVAKENLENALVVLSKVDGQEARDASRKLLARLEEWT
ncbi:ARM repeat-containing protein [Venturia nashicola]|nr:ARM repeat-containing protein [Venturia nashicola]